MQLHYCPALLLTNYFINFYNAPLFLSTVYVTGSLATNNMRQQCFHVYMH